MKEVVLKFDPDNIFEMRQSYLMQKVIDLFGLDGYATVRPKRATSPLLDKDEEGKEHHQK